MKNSGLLWREAPIAATHETAPEARMFFILFPKLLPRCFGYGEIMGCTPY